MVFRYIYFSIQVTGARLKLENIGSEIKNIKDLVWGLVSVFLLYQSAGHMIYRCFQVYINPLLLLQDEKMDSMEAKQVGILLRNGNLLSQKWFQLVTPTNHY